MANLGIRVNVDPALRERLEKAVAESTHRLSLSQIVERGIVLALDELERMENRRGGQHGQ